MTDLADRLRRTVDQVGAVTMQEIQSTARNRRSRSRRAALSGAAAVVVGAALVAILVPGTNATKVKVQPSGTTPSATAPSRPVTRSTTPAGGSPAKTCQTGQLHADVKLAGGAGGNYLYQGSLQNISADPCRLEGFPSVTPIGSSGGLLQIVSPTGATVPVTSYSLTPGKGTYILFDPPAAEPLTLSPHSAAYFDFSYVDSPAGSQTACPATDRLSVQPPDQGESLIVTPDGPLESVCSDLAVAALEKQPYA